jgi:hypothetical protein
MNRFHDSRFHGVRLVCRLRRGTPNSGSSPTTPESPAPDSSNHVKDSRDGSKSSPDPINLVASSSSPSPSKDVQQLPEDEVKEASINETATKPPTERVPERYFVVKSLTLQDLEASVRNGIWATQSHNEIALNEAYEVSEICDST